MAGIKVVTDSAADLDPMLARDRGIAIVGLDVRIGSIPPETTRQWSTEEFWQECAKTSRLPETSAPAPGAFVDAFDTFADEGADGIVCVTMSSKLSATYDAASAGAAAVASRIPVHVLDSLSVTMGEGLCALAAADAAAAGGDLGEVAAAAEQTRSNVRVFGALDTLDNLKKGGRIGGARALVGSLLSIKPVITVAGGLVEPESRQRTRARSLQYLAEKVTTAGPLKALAVVHAVAPDLDLFLDLLGRDRAEVSVSFIGPVIGTHAGRGTIGVCFELADGRAPNGPGLSQG